MTIVAKLGRDVVIQCETFPSTRIVIQTPFQAAEMKRRHPDGNIYTIDTTFDLCDYLVTPIWYRAWWFKGAPVRLGGIIIHDHEDTRTFSLAVHAIDINCDYAVSKAFGIGRDGGKGLAGAIATVAPNVRTFECLRHKEGDWDQKLQHMSVNEDDRNSIVTSIRGNGKRGNLGGLMMATQNNYADHKASTMRIWQSLLSKKHYEQWTKYWETYQDNSFQKHLLIDNYLLSDGRAHELVAFPFYDNASESGNKKIKRAIKRSETLADFIQEISDLSVTYEKADMLSRAGFGNDILLSNYKQLSITLNDALEYKTPSIRKALMDHFENEDGTEVQQQPGLSDLSIVPEEHSSLNKNILQKMKQDTLAILNNKGSIQPGPNTASGNCYIVKDNEHEDQVAIVQILLKKNKRYLICNCEEKNKFGTCRHVWSVCEFYDLWAMQIDIWVDSPFSLPIGKIIESAKTKNTRRGKKKKNQKRRRKDRKDTTYHDKRQSNIDFMDKVDHACEDDVEVMEITDSESDSGDSDSDDESDTDTDNDFNKGDTLSSSRTSTHKSQCAPSTSSNCATVKKSNKRKNLISNDGSKVQSESKNELCEDKNNELSNGSRLSSSSDSSQCPPATSTSTSVKGSKKRKRIVEDESESDGYESDVVQRRPKRQKTSLPQPPVKMSLSRQMRMIENDSKRRAMAELK